MGTVSSSQGEHGKIRVILVRAEIDYVPTPTGSEENIGLRKRVSVIGITLEGSSQGYLSHELTGPSVHAPRPHIVPNILYITRA